MDYDLSKPQKLLQESVRTFCKRKCTPERVRELMATDTAFDEELWSEIADQGWIGPHLPEAYEGLELSLVELAIIAEEFGRVCMPGPFIAANWAATLIAESGNAKLAEKYLPSIIEGELKATVALLEQGSSWAGEPQLTVTRDGNNYKLSGIKELVLDAAIADLIIVVARDGDDTCLMMVKATDSGVEITPTPSIDATRKLCRISFDAVTVPSEQVLATGESADKALHKSLQIGAIAVSAELVGIMQWTLDATVEYVKTRKQFDQPVGSFQAVQHQCAEMYLLTESSRAAAYYAAWASSENESDAARSISIAKTWCSDSARKLGNHAVQCHGGIGFTWEHDLQFYYKRSKANEFLFGDPTFHREQIAEMALCTT